MSILSPLVYNIISQVDRTKIKLLDDNFDNFPSDRKFVGIISKHRKPNPQKSCILVLTQIKIKNTIEKFKPYFSQEKIKFSFFTFPF